MSIVRGEPIPNLSKQRRYYRFIMKTDSITGGDHHAMRKLNEREHRLLDLAKEKMKYKDQILFIVFAAIKYAFVEDLIFIP